MWKASYGSKGLNSGRSRNSRSICVTVRSELASRHSTKKLSGNEKRSCVQKFRLLSLIS